jgi:ribonucleoside-triphosphate reductase
MLLDKAGVEYTVIDAESNVDLVNSLNIKKAPTLLVPKMGGYDTFENVSNIKQYIESRN